MLIPFLFIFFALFIYLFLYHAYHQSTFHPTLPRRRQRAARARVCVGGGRECRGRRIGKLLSRLHMIDSGGKRRRGSKDRGGGGRYRGDSEVGARSVRDSAKRDKEGKGHGETMGRGRGVRGRKERGSRYERGRKTEGWGEGKACYGGRRGLLWRERGVRGGI